MKTLIVVPCGSSKIWDKNPDAGPTPAEDVYTSSYFKVNRRYARLFGDRWVILSAKYGFIAPKFEIPGPYSETFKKPTAECVELWKLRFQAGVLDLSRFDTVIALGGRDYIDRVRLAFKYLRVPVRSPFYGATMLKQMKAIKALCDEKEGVSSASGR